MTRAQQSSVNCTYPLMAGLIIVIVIDNSIRFESSGRGKKKRERERKVCKMRRGGMDKF